MSQPKRHLDKFDLEAMAEGAAIKRFSKEVGESIGRVGTPKHKTKYRINPKKSKIHLHK